MAKEKNLLDGVAKFVGTEGFAQALADRLRDHSEPPCKTMGVVFEQLPGMLDPQVYAIMFTCVLEDLMTRRLEDGRNLTDAYVKRHGWKLGSTAKRQLECVRDSQMGLYEITAVTQGVGITLQDLLSDAAPFEVIAPALSGALPAGCPLAARVLRLDGTATLTGGILPFETGMSAEAAEAVKGSPDVAAAITGFWLLTTLQEQWGDTSPPENYADDEAPAPVLDEAT